MTTPAPNPDPALTPEEALAFMQHGAGVLRALSEAERPSSYAIPKAVMNCGDAQTLIGVMCRLIARDFPYAMEQPEVCADLAALNFREAH